MNELDRIRVGLTPQSSVVGSRVMRKAAKEAIQNVTVAQLKVQGLAHVAQTVADGLVDLDRSRELMAGNELLNQMLAQVELGYLKNTQRIMDGMYSPWGI
jgi:hypothetical protein